LGVSRSLGASDANVAPSVLWKRVCFDATPTSSTTLRAFSQPYSLFICSGGSVGSATFVVFAAQRAPLASPPTESRR